MYKLFLCLKYLLRRPIALVAIIGTTVCVFMVLVVTSVMDGFLDTVENAARGMLGDVIVEYDIADYEPFIKAIENDMPLVKATPVIQSAGLLRIGDGYTQLVRVVGLKMPDAAAITSFGRGLRRWDSSLGPPVDFSIHPDVQARLAELAKDAAARQDHVQLQRDQAQAALDVELAKEQPEERRVALLRDELDYWDNQLAVIKRQMAAPDLPGIIFGIDLPSLNRRDSVTGKDHPVLVEGATVSLTMLPLGKGGIISQQDVVSPAFTLVGYSRMGIYQIDREFVYVDFDLLQRLNGMAGDKALGRPPRCHQILVSVPGAEEHKLLEVAGRIKEIRKEQEGLLGEPDVIVQTWSQKQDVYVGPIRKQRTLMIIMFGIISMVAVTLVFAIFYMMVIQKTKDIGIIKSIGGSSRGVAAVFLLYGSAVGVVGSVLGVALGWLFVWKINAIHDWVAKTFNWRVFDRESYLFDKIPNQVQYNTVIAVIIGAVLAGLIGSIIPAWRAARMQPVEALGYE